VDNRADDFPGAGRVVAPEVFGLLLADVKTTPKARGTVGERVWSGRSAPLVDARRLLLRRSVLILADLAEQLGKAQGEERFPNGPLLCLV
jgi:hypothetical protein